MAHECFSCGGECYCSGDMDDCVVSLTPANCDSCGCVQDSYDDREGDEEADAWLCSCGHYEESGLHCSSCSAEPPWGCDCSFCSETPAEDLEEWEYPEY